MNWLNFNWCFSLTSKTTLMTCLQTFIENLVELTEQFLRSANIYLTRYDVNFTNLMPYKLWYMQYAYEISFISVHVALTCVNLIKILFAYAL